MSLQFTKMHGLGNDFVVIDAINQSPQLNTRQLRQLADRHLGIGCDQILLVETAQNPDNDFRYRIFNADGGEVEQCGNGARCFARFVHDQGLTDKTAIRVETRAGVIVPRLLDNGDVEVDMGVPRFEPDAIPLDLPSRQAQYSLDTPTAQGINRLDFSALSVGNPHAVIQVDSVDEADVATLGPAIESHPLFPQRVNVGFCEVIDRQTLRLRVFERGTGETQACGTGACAAMVASRQLGMVDADVSVQLRGGTLQIHWNAEGESIRMSGPTATVFHGELNQEFLLNS